MTTDDKFIWVTVGAVLVWLGVVAFMGLQVYVEMPR